MVFVCSAGFFIFLIFNCFFYTLQRLLWMFTNSYHLCLDNLQLVDGLWSCRPAQFEGMKRRRSLQRSLVDNTNRSAQLRSRGVGGWKSIRLCTQYYLLVRHSANIGYKSILFLIEKCKWKFYFNGRDGIWYSFNFLSLISETFHQNS